MLKLTVASDDGVFVEVRGEGEISNVSTQAKDNPFEQLLGAEGYARKVLLNLQAVQVLDSTGIGWLVVCHKNFKQRQGKLILFNLPESIEQVLLYCRMDTLLHLAADLEAAQRLAST